MPTRCVIVDHHTAIRDAVGRFLAEVEDIEVVGIARTGAEAEQLIAEAGPEVAVLAVQLPGSGGIEIARRLALEGSATAVILYTGESDRTLVAEAFDAGACGLVLKDAPLEDLVRAIRIVRAGGRYVDAALAGALAGPEPVEQVQLTKREREVLRLVADGMHDKQVAAELSISLQTVRTHIEHVMKKLTATTRAQAVAEALRAALI